MKINKINEDDILSYEEFMMKYETELRDSIEKGNISQELLDNLAATILDYKESIDYDYCYIIKQIYIAIIETKYFEYPNGYMESIKKITRYITALKNNKEFMLECELNPDKLSELCDNVYNELLEGGDGYYMKKDMEEEFKPEHLLDINYQLDNLKRYSTNEKFLKELDNRMWRIIP